MEVFNQMMYLFATSDFCMITLTTKISDKQLQIIDVLLSKNFLNTISIQGSDGWKEQFEHGS